MIRICWFLKNLYVSNTPSIAITVGDPCGIGPEVTLKALASHRSSRKYIVISSPEVFHRDFSPLHYQLKEELPGTLDISFHSVGEMQSSLKPGSESGALSLAYIDHALDLYDKGEITALVTGPVSKEHIEGSGVPFTGHTEYLARHTGGSPLMLMYSGELNVIPATTHVAIDRLSGLLTADLLVDVITRGYEAVRKVVGEEITVAVTGRDPHCGDGGAISTFDDSVTSLAVKRAQAEGIPVEGPFAADTLFMPEISGKYQLIITHYHDQGLIPFKMTAFDSGVNITLGIPLVRTSVDHGTAFDMAGKGTASFTSMVRAMEMAEKLAANR
jgi:4-phospho-D-threonate 3-dehydrogenase / 4-phospho-D-erythronate 3-dehydrogenase